MEPKDVIGVLLIVVIVATFAYAEVADSWHERHRKRAEQKPVIGEWDSSYKRHRNHEDREIWGVQFRLAAREVCGTDRRAYIALCGRAGVSHETWKYYPEQVLPYRRQPVIGANGKILSYKFIPDERIDEL
jgi:hypothetical protein